MRRLGRGKERCNWGVGQRWRFWELLASGPSRDTDTQTVEGKNRRVRQNTDSRCVREKEALNLVKLVRLMGSSAITSMSYTLAQETQDIRRVTSHTTMLTQRALFKMFCAACIWFRDGCWQQCRGREMNFLSSVRFSARACES